MEQAEIQEKLFTEVERIRSLDGQTDVTAFLQMIKESDGINKAEELAGCYIAKAIRALEPLPGLKAKQNLTDIAHFVGTRSY